MNSLIKKIFIANRGEIARRIAITANKLGCSVACISEKSLPPKYLSDYIDDFIKVDKAPVSLFLDADKMIELAKNCGADAIHPGYGFLSENARFAKKVSEAGLVWIGPSHDAIEKMAHKSQALDIALNLGVPCNESLSLPSIDEGSILKATKPLRFPLLIKAALGGGGKGMRVVTDKEKLLEEVKRAHSEAKHAFGDGTLLVEHFVEHARHVEVQVLGDKHGNVITLGDRDCSIQRRYQKIIEEAPAPDLHPDTRRKLHEHARLLAQSVNYYSTGTVEFLVDSQKGSLVEQPFYFLEMNTRLQVEHPVTEAVFGLDLVDWQIRIANGEAIPNDLMNISPKGHSIEARIYSEDPENNFFPSPGVIVNFQPYYGHGVRWDIGLDEQDEVTSEYDPMVAKVIVHSLDRFSAIKLLSDTVEKTCFLGPKNNLHFLKSICGDSDFINFVISTNFLNTHTNKLLEDCNETQKKLENKAQKIFDILETSGSILGYKRTKNISVLDRSLEIYSTLNLPKISAVVDQIDIINESHTSVGSRPNSSFLFGKGFFSDIKEQFYYGSVLEDGSKAVFCQIAGNLYSYKSNRKKRKDYKNVGSSLETAGIVAPVPSKVFKVLVKKGDSVLPGEVITILDSMKTEFKIKAHRAGVIDKIFVTEGEQVENGQLLIKLKQ